MKYRSPNPISYLIITLLLFATTPLWAQTATLVGTVTDAETGDTLPGANIRLTGPGFETATLTTLNGKFEIESIPAGTYTIRTSYIGFKETRIENLTLQDGETKSLALALSPTTIQLNPIAVTAMRRPERVIESPAAINVVDQSDIQSQPALSLLEHPKGIAGVNIHKMGLTSGRVTIRGFNYFFAGRLLTLTDHRIANIPGVRLNWTQLIPTTDDDIERIEVVLGPGSALYGPNAAGGVMHIITRSPFDAPGTTVSVGLGERDVRMGSFRHAGTLNDRVGYKITGQYQQGSDWSYTDPAEPDSIIKGTATPSGRVNQGGKIPNQRNLDVEKFSGEGRLDIRLDNGLKATLSGGFCQISNIELAPSSAFQIENWSEGFVQGRLSYKDLFAQMFFNWNDSGESYNLRTGDFWVDKSTQLVTQIQHGFTLLQDRQRFTYGAEILLTRLDSDKTIFGRNEAKSDINEVGVYVQSETELSSRLKWVMAARFDDQNFLPDPVFSPRAALVFNPNPLHKFRITYNQAFQTPTPPSLFLDINILPTLGGLPYAVEFLGIPPKTGFNFRRDANGGTGGLYMQSPFVPENVGGRSAYLPADATLMWGAVVAILQAQGVDLSALPPPGSNQVGTVLKTLNTGTGTFDLTPPEKVVDIAPLNSRKTTTYEIGYKGIVNNQLLLTTNLYYEKNLNFLGLGMRSPNVFFDGGSLAAYLGQFLPTENVAALADPAAGIPAIPVGTVAPQEGKPADLLFTLIEFGDLSYYGAEFGAAYHATPNWTLTGDYTYLSKNFFARQADEPEDLTLNAPKHKLGASIGFHKPDLGFNARLRMRYLGSYPIISGIYGQDTIQSYTTFDLNANYQLQSQPNLGFSLSVQNLFDKKHRGFIAVPETGRLALLRLTYSS